MATSAIAFQLNFAFAIRIFHAFKREMTRIPRLIISLR